MRIKLWLGILITSLIVAIPLFSHLDSLPIQSWDEARVVTNSLEMYQGKGDNILVPTYYGEPEMWNTKPPLLLWLQVICMKIFGVNELAVRLPSAVAAYLTCLLLFWFCARKLNKPWLGILTAAILVTSEGYIRVHGARTGDYEALLIMFTTGYALFYYLFLTTKKIKYCYITFLLLSLACLTKGVAALLFSPALLAFTLMYHRHYFIFKTKHFYYCICMFVFVVVGYYLLREHYNPGYINAVMENELGGRYNVALEEHQGSFWYYWDWIKATGFSNWLIFLPLGWAIGVTATSKKVRSLYIYITLLIVVQFTIISVAKTKLNWYEMPLYPFLSLITAVCFFTVLRVAAGYITKVRVKYSLLIILTVACIFYKPYSNIIDVVENSMPPNVDHENMNMAHYLKDAKDGKHNIEGVKLVWDEFQPNLTWYVFAYWGRPEQYVRYSHELQPGQYAAVYKAGTRQYMENLYTYNIIGSYHGVAIYKILTRK